MMEREKGALVERSRQGAERDFQGQFHSVERASSGRPPAVMQKMKARRSLLWG